jgi:putative transposase
LLVLSGLARSTYYYYTNQKDNDKYEKIKADIADIFNKNKGRYGYERITQVLKEQGYIINHKTVLKLMNILGLKGKQRKNEKYHSYKGEIRKISDNLLKRDFYADKPFEKLVTDIT